MKKNTSLVASMTIAVTQMKAMVNFYTQVFGIEFKANENYGITLYNGKLGEINLQFCPADIAGISATENRHQLDIVVSDLNKAIEAVEANGGQLLQEVVETETAKSVGVYDPDGNSVVLVERV